VYGELQGSGGPYPANPGNVDWANPGDTPGPGWPLHPTTGLITPYLDPVVTKPNRTWLGWKMLGTGTIDIRSFITLIGVVGGAVTITVSVAKNGTPIESETIVPGWSGGLAGWTGHSLIEMTGVSVATNDIISLQLGWTGPMYFGRTPAGTGQNGETLKIVGGSLA
jgi:hypothetical protein